MSRRPLRGFVATTIALTMLALVGLALTELSRSFSADIRRTADESAQAQLRQLSLAGILQARQLLQQNSASAVVQLSLPDELASQGAKVSIRLTPTSDAAPVNVDAVLGGRHVETEVHFSRDASGWQMQ